MNNLFNNTFATLKSKKILIKKGNYLFLQNNEILNMYYITTGRLTLQRNTLDGLPVILLMLRTDYYKSIAYKFLGVLQVAFYLRRA